MRIAIAGKKDTSENYLKYVASLGLQPVLSLFTGDLASCDGLLLPGGGDVSPAFFGETMRGSRNIDTELDLLQLRALSLYLTSGKPVLGICRGMQLINIAFGGNLYQDISTSCLHQKKGGDVYHITAIQKHSYLYDLYGEAAVVNSNHHQALRTLGTGLVCVQTCPLDGHMEAIAHTHLPIFGVQWHPERLDDSKTEVCGRKLLEYFVTQIRTP